MTRIFLVLLLICTCLGFGPCGYEKAGSGKALPDHIHTIAVQTFRNDSLRYRVEQKFTSAVIDELLHRSSRFKFVSAADQADAVVAGNIRNFSFRPVLLDNNGRARAFEITITVGVTVRDQTTNKVIFDNQRIMFRNEYELTNDPRTFFNEEDPAVDRIARDFARSLFSTVMEGFSN